MLKYDGQRFSPPTPKKNLSITKFVSDRFVEVFRRVDEAKLLQQRVVCSTFEGALDFTNVNR